MKIERFGQFDDPLQLDLENDIYFDEDEFKQFVENEVITADEYGLTKESKTKDDNYLRQAKNHLHCTLAIFYGDRSIAMSYLDKYGDKTGTEVLSGLVQKILEEEGIEDMLVKALKKLKKA